MRLSSWFYNLVGKARALRSSRRTPSVFVAPYGGYGYYGQSYRWEQVLRYKFWTFVAIRAWVHEIAGGEPPNIGRIKKRSKQAKRNKALGGPREHQDFEPYDDDHPLVRLFKNPNDPDVAYDFWAFHVLFKKLTGQAHWWVMRNAFGVPVEMWVVPTHWMRLETGRDAYPSHYVIQSPWGPQASVPYEDVISFYEHSPLNRYEGHAVTQAIGEWIDTYEAHTRTRLATLKNGAVPAFHVMLGESYSDPDDAMLNRFYAKWFRRFQGEDKAGLPIITGADVEMKDIGHKPEDVLVATVQTEDQMRDMTLAAFQVPKGVVGLEPSSDVSAYAPQRQFCRFAINPELRYTGQVATEKVIKPVDPEGCLYWDDRVIDDPEQQERELAADMADGTLTPNEKRGIRGREPYPHGGDDPMVNGSPVPWVTGSLDDEMSNAFEEALGRPGEGSGDGGLRDTIEGFNAIVDLQAKFYAGEILREAAMTNAVLLLGFTSEEAASLFPPTKLAAGDTAQADGREERSLSSAAGSAGGYLVNGRK